MLGTAFLLGAAHALEPGHGKTLVAAYMTGTRGRVQDALLVGLLVTVCHTLSVFCLGLVAVLLADLFIRFKAEVAQSFQVISGLMILGIGVMLFWRRFVSDRSADECECHLPHVHPPENDGEWTETRSLKSVVSLGVASGISPCPSALAAMLASIGFGGMNRLPEALTYLFVFSLGLSSVLVVIGVLLVLSAGRFRGLLVARQSRLPVLVSQVSIAVMILLGLYMTIRPLWGPIDGAEWRHVVIPSLTNR